LKFLLPNFFLDSGLGEQAVTQTKLIPAIQLKVAKFFLFLSCASQKEESISCHPQMELSLR